jgi:hypothetical protein
VWLTECRGARKLFSRRPALTMFRQPPPLLHTRSLPHADILDDSLLRFEMGWPDAYTASSNDGPT